MIGKLNFTWRKPNFTGIANFTFAKQKLHFAKNYRTTDIKKYLVAAVAVKYGSIVKKIRLNEVK